MEWRVLPRPRHNAVTRTRRIPERDYKSRRRWPRHIYWTLVGRGGL